MTRAERRKRNLVWRKTAPMFAPEYLELRLSRYVPQALPTMRVGELDETKQWAVWDRKEAKFLSQCELVKIKDDALWNEKFGLS